MEPGPSHLVGELLPCLDAAEPRVIDFEKLSQRCNASVADTETPGQIMMMRHGQMKASSPRNRRAVLTGIVVGILVALPAIVAAAISGSAGHGRYVAARTLIPFAMMLARGEGSIGALSISAALIQFPLYGAVLGWSFSRANYAAVIFLIIVHLAAAAFCFAVPLPNFS